MARRLGQTLGSQMKQLLTVVLTVGACNMFNAAHVGRGKFHSFVGHKHMHIRIFHAFAVLLVAASLAACSAPSITHRLELRDEFGTVVATLTVVIPSSLPPSAQQFEGSWQLQSHTGAFPIGAVQSGHYLGFHGDGRVLLDLNPDWADNNVVLEAPAKMKPLAGRWRLATAAGFRPGGSFRSSQ